MQVVVKKFGGTSVGDIARIRHVARLVRQHREAHPDEQVVVVVSAMAGETNRLISLAKSCTSQPDPRELDMLVATGEQVTIALLAMALIELGVPAKSLLASQARIATDRRFTAAHIEQVEPQRIRAALDAGQVPVIAGFQGTTRDGEVTTLGRGGSDITAVAVAAALRARACYIYTDVEGVYSADPRICRNARILPRVTHDEMLEMASLGAKVLHPRSVYFAMRYKVPLVTRSTFVPSEGTWIVPEEDLVEKHVVTGITHRDDEAKLTVHGIPKGPAALERIFTALEAQQIFVDMITQTGYREDETSVSFTVPDESSSRALELMRELVPVLGARGASLDRDIAKVSVVGIGMRYHSGVAGKMFASLAAEQIEVQMISTSDVKISVLVPRKYAEVAVRALHDAFIGDHPELVRSTEAA